MSRLGIALVFSISSVTFCSPYAHSQWILQESGTTANLRGVWFADSLNGWACGDSGTVIHTDDGGKHWMSQTSGVTFSLNDITFVSADTGWAIGDGGTIINTIDGGENWTSLASGVSVDLNQIEFVGEASAIFQAQIVADSGATLFTTDNGFTWGTEYGYGGRDISAFLYRDVSRWVYFVDTRGNGEFSTMFFTQDHGQTYDSTAVISFANDTESNGNSSSYYWVACRGGLIFRSTNYGFTWTIGIIDEPDTTIDFKGIRLARVGGTIWAVGEAGKVIRSTDLGVSWTTEASGVSANLNMVSFSGETHGWAVGDSGTIISFSPVVGVSSVIESMPEYVEVLNAFPNPFNSFATIRYTIPTRTLITIRIIDIQGREVLNFSREEDRGVHEFKLDGSQSASGVYLISVSALKNSQAVKIMLLR